MKTLWYVIILHDPKLSKGFLNVSCSFSSTLMQHPLLSKGLLFSRKYLKLPYRLFPQSTILSCQVLLLRNENFRFLIASPKWIPTKIWSYFRSRRPCNLPDVKVLQHHIYTVFLSDGDQSLRQIGCVWTRVKFIGDSVKAMSSELGDAEHLVLALISTGFVIHEPWNWQNAWIRSKWKHSQYSQSCFKENLSVSYWYSQKRDDRT